MKLRLLTIAGWAFFGLPPLLPAQTFTLGVPNTADPCTGGTAFTNAAGASMRFGDFTCFVNVPSEGSYQVRLDFQEPCSAVTVPGCSAIAVGQRVENIYINDAPAVVALDPLAAGAATSIISRGALAYSAGLRLVIRVETVTGKRAAVLSGITVTDGPPIGNGLGKIYFDSGTPPADTSCCGHVYDAVMYIDQTGALKILRKDGTIAVLPLRIATAPSTAVGGIGPLELWRAGQASYVAAPSTPQIDAAPAWVHIP